MEYRLSVVMCQFLFLITDLVILYNLRKNKDESRRNRLFIRFAITAVLQQAVCLFTESVCPELWMPPRILYQIALMGLFTLVTICGFYWYSYLREIVAGDRQSGIRRHLLSILPIVVMAAAAGTSPVTHWVFCLDSNGLYQRGSFFFLQMLLPYSYLVMACVFALREQRRGKREIVRKMLRYFLFFTIPSIVCAAIQMLVIRGGYSSIGISIGLILMYLELYIDEVNDGKRLKDVESLNQMLQQVNDEQEEQLEEIIGLNRTLSRKQAQLETASEEQAQQLEQIRALNDRLQRYTFMIEASTKNLFCIYWVDLAEGTMTEARSLTAMSERLGHSGDARQMMAATADQFVQQEDQAAMRDFFAMDEWQARLRSHDSFSCEYRGLTTGWSRATAFAARRNHFGEVTHVVLTAQSIREEVEARRQLQEARDASEAANNAKTAFLFNMSHDIRTPMNAIIGFRDLLERHQEDPEMRADYLRKIESASSVLLSIINNVLEMARIEKGTIEIDETAWSAEQFIESVYSIFQEMMEQKQITFTRMVNVRNPYVFCDPIKLREVAINLLSNAYKYTNPGGSVHMLLEELPCDRDGYTFFRLTVSDSGIGMSEEFLPHLFEEFSREQNTTEARVEGTGLGMPIVRRLVELMGGTISVASRKGEGSTFMVTIPHRIAQRQEIAACAPVEVAPERFIGRRLLLAEDNELNAEIAVELLSEAGFIVDHARDGAECVEMLKNAAAGCYEAILMDIQMPKMDGCEAARAIRKLDDPKKAGITILAVTANAFEEDKRAALRAGMNGHLAKPINMQELLQALAGALD